MIKALKFRKSYLNFAHTKDIIDLLLKERIVQVVEDKNNIVIGRYETNKGRLKKVLE